MSDPTKKNARARTYYRLNAERIKAKVYMRRWGVLPSVLTACAICGGTEQLAIDHPHGAQHLRGVLCRKCNLGLGLFRDDPLLLQSAITYLAGAEWLSNSDGGPLVIPESAGSYLRSHARRPSI